jgi:hypothetical protein
LEEAMRQVQAEEAKAHANNVAEEQKLKDLKAQILDEEKGVIEQAKKKFDGVGETTKEGIENAGDKISQKINDVDTSLKTNTAQLSLQIQSLANEIAKIAPAISAIQFPSFPTIPAPPPTIVKVDIDTDGMSKEETQLSIKSTLEGYFVNQ